MRLFVTVLLLLTPLQSVAALAFCVSQEQGTAIPCDPGISEMGERNNESPDAPEPAPADNAHLATISSADAMIGGGPCGAVGLCSAPVPGIVSVAARALPESPADTGPLSSLARLGPGVRPPPPLHPPRA